MPPPPFELTRHIYRKEDNKAGRDPNAGFVVSEQKNKLEEKKIYDLITPRGKCDGLL